MSVEKLDEIVDSFASLSRLLRDGPIAPRGAEAMVYVVGAVVLALVSERLFV